MRIPERDDAAGLYRSRKGVIFGVCRGLADHLNLSVVWVRVIAVILMFVSAGWAIALYLLAGLMMKPDGCWTNSQLACTFVPKAWVGARHCCCSGPTMLRSRNLSFHRHLTTLTQRSSCEV